MHVRMPRQCAFHLQPERAATAGLDQALLEFADLFPGARDAWRNDLLRLLVLARSLAPSAGLRIRLETKASEGCSLFHVDNVPLRLICTYRGAGTQWLPDTAFDRCGLGRGNNDFVHDWSELCQMPTGAVAVLKGLRFPGQDKLALVHRSPPADAAFPRVLVAIDINPL